MAGDDKWPQQATAVAIFGRPTLTALGTWPRILAASTAVIGQTVTGSAMLSTPIRQEELAFQPSLCAETKDYL